MSGDNRNTPVQVSVYSDYICPFCYIGFLRLERLRRELEVDVDWWFLEIHPDNPAQGRPLSELGYPPRHWELLMTNLSRMAREEGVELPERTFTTNSRQALKLAQAARERQPDAFPALNRELYEAYFLRQRNIGDPAVLEELSDACGVERETAAAAREDEHYERVLRENQHSAARLQIGGTPTYVFGDRVYSGAIPLEMLRQAAVDSTGRRQS